jgi:oligopeptide transport system permease protein
MASFFLKRVLQGVVTLFLVMTVLFFVLRVVPGGPFDSEKALPEEIKANLDRRFGLDQPLPLQYVIYIRGLMRGDLGPSFRNMGGSQIADVIALSLPVSLKLGLLALCFALVLGVPLGVLAAQKQGRWQDWGSMAFAVSGISLPAYLLATILILIFALELRWFPVALIEGPSSYVLPAVALGFRPLALIARMTRASLIEVLSLDFIRTARSKGLSEPAVVYVHGLRNALIPVVTVLGPITASLLTGSFLVESMFAIPGLGRYFVSAVIDRDYTMIMGVTLVYGVILILMNILVDMAYAVIDPRVRLS